ncbi:hypothetical protein [Flavobacterium pallidum]|uniref:Uncharacterized protein n=1 Tax=Flavobacterium pallidum TaxID=2172098 RepID=A0A2S1SG23_9FLAO|nr:hypothetical protein [Flavobacterium pallidum]AWI25363.1 hypothetical protein HYN49_05310 [Flavobacterium pallidum]
MKIHRFIVLLSILLTQSVAVPPQFMDIDDSVKLEWHKSYADDTMDKAVVGLRWALSYVGAKSLGPSEITVSGNTASINAYKLGLNENAVNALKILHQAIRESGEYKRNKSIDMGRYVSLILGSPQHYYALTGVPEKLDDLLAGYTLLEDKGYVNHSAVSLKHRIIRFSGQDKMRQVFLSAETDPATGRIEEYETLEIMDNAQLRFGIFDADGNRMDHADPSVTNAGKPAKCMWCHESTISPMFKPQDEVHSYLSYNALQDKLKAYNQSLTEQKALLKEGVDYLKLQDHTFTELLYITFMEPSAERLSAEWGMPLAEVQQRLSGLSTHVCEEFPYLGPLYQRKEVEKLAPYQGLEVSGSVREMSSEVNYIHD